MALQATVSKRARSKGGAIKFARRNGRFKPKANSEQLKARGRRPTSVLSKFYGQATKGAWWMPWQKTAMKDVASCDKPRGAASRL